MELKHLANPQIQVYTTLRLLQRMFNQMGIEATIEYINKYVNYASEKCPMMKEATDKAIGISDIHKIYSNTINMKGDTNE